MDFYGLFVSVSEYVRGNKKSNCKSLIIRGCSQFTQNTQAMFLGKGQQNIQGGIGVITVLHRIDK